MSNPDIPVTPVDSQDKNQPRPQSTRPSSPMTDADQEMEDSKDSLANGTEDTTEDVEEMDTKAKALMHLLNTSEVSLPALLRRMDWGSRFGDRTYRSSWLSWRTR